MNPACSGSGSFVPAFLYISTCFKWTYQTTPLAVLLNGIGLYGLDLPPWLLKRCTLVIRRIYLTSCNITYPRCLCAHPVLISFQFPSPLSIWISCFSVFHCKSLEFITCQYLWISVTSYFQTSSKDFFLSVSLPPFCCPPCLQYLRARTLILLRLWLYINHVLTFLLTYLVDLQENQTACDSSGVRRFRMWHMAWAWWLHDFITTVASTSNVSHWSMMTLST